MKKGIQRAKYETSIQSYFLLAHTGVAGGKILPVIVPEARGIEELRSLITVHRAGNILGDVTTTWGYSKKLFSTQVMLHIEFLTPIELTMFLTFNVETEFHLIDQILDVQAFYLFMPEKEERDIDDLVENSISVEVHGDFEHWDKMYRKYCFHELKRSLGSGREAKRHLDDYIKMKRLAYIGI